jgi:hypothetical protein
MRISQTKGRFSEIRLPLFPSTSGPLPFPLDELVHRGSGLVQGFRVLQFNVAANLSLALSFYHCISKKSHFLGNTDFFRRPGFIIPEMLVVHMCHVTGPRKRVNAYGSALSGDREIESLAYASEFLDPAVFLASSSLLVLGCLFSDKGDLFWALI